MQAKAFILPPVTADRERVVENLHSFLMTAVPGKQLKVTIQVATKRRSDEQNRYLWGVVYPTILQSSEELGGWSAEDLHEYFLGEIYGWDTLAGFGRKRLRPIRRSSGMSTVEFNDFISQIQQRMAEQGVFIPDPT
jgi:hypothetical protein